MPPRYFISNEEDYRALESDAAAIFRLEERLPGQVFRETMGIFRFFDIVKFAQPEFWTMLLELATLFGDQEIRILIQEPSAFEYKEWMAVFGALRFPFSATGQEYFDTFRYDSCDGKTLPASVLFRQYVLLVWFVSALGDLRASRLGLGDWSNSIV